MTINWYLWINNSSKSETRYRHLPLLLGSVSKDLISLMRAESWNSHEKGKTTERVETRNLTVTEHHDWNSLSYRFAWNVFVVLGFLTLPKSTLHKWLFQNPICLRWVQKPHTGELHSSSSALTSVHKMWLSDSVFYFMLVALFFAKTYLLNTWIKLELKI